MRFHHFHHDPEAADFEPRGGQHRFMRHRMRHHMRRGGRMFDQGDLRFVVLRLIAEKPAYGYEIIKAIEERLAGAYAPSPGIVYPTLTLLEELGYIAIAGTEGPRKLYAITDAGRAALDENQTTVEAIFARMDDIHARHGGGPAPQVLRASENLKVALRLRLARGPLREEEITRIAEALDQAARAIEAS
jgi:DNA-binding PadR family transcriptional regulator